MKKEWKVAECGSGKSLIERLLISRGITEESDIKTFLNPLETNITSPNSFTDMSKAVERISKAIDDKECILVYGDFDADGVTSTSLLLRALNILGANVIHFIPDREKEGHGLNTKALVKLMAAYKPKVIITVDCGVSDVEQVNFVKSFKIDVVITDHHEAPEVLPPALAIINPKAPNALSDRLSAKEINDLASLAGVGVAFKLAHGLFEHYGKTSYISKLLPYVAVGTVSDVVPLVGENRYFVTKGLEIISAGKHYGLKRLLESAGYSVEKGVTAENIAFGVAPRINASGRLDSVDAALKVLSSDNKQEIEMAIITLNDFNRVRQELCDNTFSQAEELLKNQGKNDSAIVLFNPKWHVGIVGIVASKLVEKYYKPAFLMTYSEETKQVRCSARSVEGIHLYDAISANAELFDGFGGHAMAAGLSFSAERASVEDVKKALCSTIKEMSGGKTLVPFLNVDIELKPGEITTNLISDIARLEPFGAANPKPVFAMYNLTLVQKKLMGTNKNHLKLTVQDEAGNVFDAIWWSHGNVTLNSGDTLDIAFCPQLNSFNDQTSIQLILQDVHSENLVEEDNDVPAKKNEIKVFDHRKKTGIFKSVNDYVGGSDLSIKVFAESKNVISVIKKYNALSRNVVNRDTIEPCHSVMFFDYPPNLEIFDEIILKASPKHVHLMNCEVHKFDEKELLKTFSGMIKFACNNKDGKFELERSAVFLGITTETVASLLEVFDESSMIEIEDRDEDLFKIKYLSNVEISKTLHTTGYESFSKHLKDIEMFKSSILNEEIKL